MHEIARDAVKQLRLPLLSAEELEVVEEESKKDRFIAVSFICGFCHMFLVHLRKKKSQIIFLFDKYLLEYCYCIKVPFTSISLNNDRLCFLLCLHLFYRMGLLHMLGNFMHENKQIKRTSCISDAEEQIPESITST